jgi:hypothetical protein
MKGCEIHRNPSPRQVFRFAGGRACAGFFRGGGADRTKRRNEGVGYFYGRIRKHGLTVLVVFFLFLGAAQAEELEISGTFEVGFGQADFAGTGETTLDGVGEGTVNFAAEKGPVSAQLEITVAETTEELDTAEHEVVWSATDSLSVRISGAALDLAATEENISVVNAAGGLIGDEEANLDFSGLGLLSLEYGLGGLTLGLALLDSCVPECGYGLVSVEEAPIHPETERMTTLVHLVGRRDGFTYKAYLARSSGTYSPSSPAGEGSGAGIGLVYEAEGFYAALDASSATVECTPAAGDLPCSDDNEQTRYGFAVDLSGFRFHYYFGEDKTGPDTEEVTNVDLVYVFAVGDALIGPEYRVTETETSDGLSTTDTFLLFGMSLEF